mgnify:FL=1
MRALLTLLVTVPAWLWLQVRFHGAADFSAIHQTVIVAIGYYVVQFERNPYAQYVAILMASFAASWSLYEGVIRRIAVLRWLFGIKPSRR